MGRGMLASAMVLSRFRYPAQCMDVPPHINQAIAEDTQALIWAKEVEFNPDELGTNTKFRRWMRDRAQYGNRIESLGLGILDWQEHLKGLRTRWLFRYLDATRGLYKQVLDAWFSRYHEGRGAILTTIPIRDLCKSTTNRLSALPKFWRQALSDLRSLTLERARPNCCTSADEARAMPVWTNPLFKVCACAHVEHWRYTPSNLTLSRTPSNLSPLERTPARSTAIRICAPTSCKDLKLYLMSTSRSPVGD